MLTIESKIIGRRVSKHYKNFKVGEAITLYYESKLGFWKIRKFSGIVISKTNNGYNTFYVLRNVLNNVPIEFKFFIMSSEVVKIKRLSIKKVSKINKNKLYFLRKKRLNLSKV